MITSGGECVAAIISKSKCVVVRVFWSFYFDIIIAIKAGNRLTTWIIILNTYVWHTLKPSDPKQRRIRGVGSRNVLHEPSMKSKDKSPCRTNLQPSILLIWIKLSKCCKYKRFLLVFCYYNNHLHQNTTFLPSKWLHNPDGQLYLHQI